MAGADNLKVPAGFFESNEEHNEVLRSITEPQNEEERRQIREDYRKLQDELIDKRHELINPAFEKDLLTENVDKVDRLFRRVQMTREGTLDAASLLNISELGKTKAQALKADFVSFSPSDFCDKLPTWCYARKGIMLPKTVVVTPAQQDGLLTILCGSFERGEVTVKKRKPAPEKEKEKVVDNKATIPTQLSSMEETDRGELTTAQVEHLLDTLWQHYQQNDNQPICYFEFVTNPHSFGQTVENIFYASFLIRDGHARMFLDYDELPVIEPIERTQNEETVKTKQAAQSKQVVITITPEEWEEIVRVFEIEVPLIKDLRKS